MYEFGTTHWQANKNRDAKHNRNRTTTTATRSTIANGQHPNKMINTFSKMEDAPMRFEIKEGAVDCKTIKVLCDDADGNVCKRNCQLLSIPRPERLSSSSSKKFWQCKRDFEWFAADDDGNNNADNKKTLIFQHVGRTLKGMPQRKWAKITKNHHNFTTYERLSRQGAASHLGDLCRWRIGETITVPMWHTNAP